MIWTPRHAGHRGVKLSTKGNRNLASLSHVFRKQYSGRKSCTIFLIRTQQNFKDILSNIAFIPVHILYKYVIFLIHLLTKGRQALYSRKSPRVVGSNHLTSPSPPPPPTHSSFPHKPYPLELLLPRQLCHDSPAAYSIHCITVQFTPCMPRPFPPSTLSANFARIFTKTFAPLLVLLTFIMQLLRLPRYTPLFFRAFGDILFNFKSGFLRVPPALANYPGFVANINDGEYSVRCKNR